MSMLPDHQSHPDMPDELRRLPQLRYSRSRFTCRADFPPHMLERSGMIMQRRAERVERQTGARAQMLAGRAAWWAKRRGKSSAPPRKTNQPHHPMSIDQLLTQIRRSGKATRLALASCQRRLKPVSSSSPRSMPARVRRAA